MALSTEFENPLTQIPSLLPQEYQRPSTPDIQTDVEAICAKWGIPPPKLDEKLSTSSTLLEEDLLALTTLVSSFNEPWYDIGGEWTGVDTNSTATTPEENAVPSHHQTQGYSPQWLSSQSPGSTCSSALDAPRPFTGLPEAWELEPPNVFYDHWSPESSIYSAHPASRHTAYDTPVRRNSECRSSIPGPVAPSKRQTSVHGYIVSASQPYPLPSHHSFHERHSPPATRLYTPSSSSERGRKEAGPSRTYSPYEPLSAPKASIPRMRRGRLPVPLGDWRPKRAPKLPLESNGIIEFWSKDNVTGEKVLGTFLADRFREETRRSLLSEKSLPFPEKREKGFNLRVLWPGYPEFSKKISVHRSLSECTLRDARDWVFNAVSDFIRTPGVQFQESEFWRVGAEDESAIHLDDLVLVRLRQVGKGTWVPELDLLDWDRVV